MSDRAATHSRLRDTNKPLACKMIIIIIEKTAAIHILYGRWSLFVVRWSSEIISFYDSKRRPPTFN